MEPNKPSPEKIKKMEDEMNKKITVTFTKRSLVIMLNFLTQTPFAFKEFRDIVMPIIKELEAVLVVDSNIPQTNHKKVIT